DLESGMRGYLIAGEEVFLAPYHRGLPIFESGLAELKQQVGDDPAQRRRVERIEALENQWMEFAKLAIERRREGLPVVEYIRSDRGRQLIEQMRGQFNELIEAERVKRAARSDQAEVITTALVGGFLLFSLIFSGLLVFLARRDLLGLSQTY